MAQVTLAIDLAGVPLPTPVLGASGTVGSGRELSELVDLGEVGGIITKSVTPRPLRGIQVPRMVETPSGMLNAIGLQNPGIDGFIERDGPWIAEAGAPVILSIAGTSVDEFLYVASRVPELEGVVAVEANISCPNVEARNQVFACDPNAAASVVAAVRDRVEVPVFAKLTADVTDIVAVARACMDAGAHGLSLINTLLGMSIDVETFRPSLSAMTGGLSGPAIRPIAVRTVWQVASAMPEVPIIGSGGIESARDAVEFLLAGAWAVAVGTANFYNPHATVEIGKGIAEFLASRELTSPVDLRGKVTARAPVAEPAYRSG